MPTRDKGMQRMAARLAGVLLVTALHAAALYGLWRVRSIPSPAEVLPLFVNFIAPPQTKKADEPRRTPEPGPRRRLVESAQFRPRVAETPVTMATESVAPPPPVLPEPVQSALATAPVMQIPLPTGPVALASELSVACPHRAAPRYPATSRRLGEFGVVVLRVELSETGQVALARVQSSSGFARLDDAALSAVSSWHCTPSTRNGQPVRATALQPFNFVIQGS
jgi:protein TonB